MALLEVFGDLGILSICFAFCRIVRMQGFFDSALPLLLQSPPRNSDPLMSSFISLPCFLNAYGPRPDPKLPPPWPPEGWSRKHLHIGPPPHTLALFRHFFIAQFLDPLEWTLTASSTVLPSPLRADRPLSNGVFPDRFDFPRPFFAVALLIHRKPN